jgi:hypothetical protein
MARAKGRKLHELRDEADAVAARERERLEAGGAESDVAEEEAKPKKAKKKAAEPKAPRKKTAKLVRKRLVWVVYDNAHKAVARFPYPDKKLAEEKAEQLKTDKKQTYFVQPVKEEWPAE